MAIPLYQFWHSPDAPEDVAEWMSGMRDVNRDMSYRRYDSRSGRAYVGDRLGSRAVAAYDACAQPAMEADLLRLALLWAEGGLWADSGGLQALKPISGLLDQIPYAFVSGWLELWGNTVMFFRRPGSPYLKACIDLVIDNIENRRGTKALVATGPGMMNAVRGAIDDPHMAVTLILAENGGWNPWGFEEVLAAAKRIIAPSEAMAWDRASIVILNTFPMDPYLSRRQASYKLTQDWWYKSEAGLYR